jgi:hypothetical protein
LAILCIDGAGLLQKAVGAPVFGMIDLQEVGHIHLGSSVAEGSEVTLEDCLS